MRNNYENSKYQTFIRKYEMFGIKITENQITIEFGKRAPHQPHILNYEKNQLYKIDFMNETKNHSWSVIKSLNIEDIEEYHPIAADVKLINHNYDEKNKILELMVEYL